MNGQFNIRKQRNISFQSFLEFFPEVELPVMLTSETASEFSKYNHPFSASIIQEYCIEWDIEVDEFTEYIPCFKIPDTGDFTAIVYYKATLLEYGFFIVTYLNSGELISKKPLNSILLADDSIKNSAATIDEDWVIKIVSGEQVIKELDYDTSKSKTTSLEILPTGDIIYGLQD